MPYTVLDGQTPKRIGVIVNEGLVGQIGVEAVECNFQADLAIAVRSGVIGQPEDAWALRLSDGATLGHWAYAGTGVASIVPSSDGGFIAENGPQSTRIRSVPDGAVVGTLPSANVYAFSGDDRFVVEGPGTDAGPVRIVEWQTGRQIWQSQDNWWPDPIQVTAGIGDVAIALASPEQISNLTQDNAKLVVIVHADGTEADLPGRYVPLFPPYADGYYPYRGGPP